MVESPDLKSGDGQGDAGAVETATRAGLTQEAFLDLARVFGLDCSAPYVATDLYREVLRLHALTSSLKPADSDRSWSRPPPLPTLDSGPQLEVKPAADGVPWSMTASELDFLLEHRELSAREVIESHLARIEGMQTVSNAYTVVMAERALHEATLIDKQAAEKRPRRSLQGVPFAVKDSFDVQGFTTDSGVVGWGEQPAQADSTVTARMRRSRAVLLGKLNMTPLALGFLGQNPDYGDVPNPWNPDFTSGGSSSGSAAAVALGETPLAFGSDTGGSIRIPAAFCGVVGLKPTYGLLSRAGVGPLSHSLDHVGPITRTVEDCALALNIVVGRDSRDSTTIPPPRGDYSRVLKKGVAGVRIGVPRDIDEYPLDPEVARLWGEALAVLDGVGAHIDEIDWPAPDRSAAVAAAVVPAEAAARIGERLRLVGQRVEDSVRLRVERGYFVSGYDYVLAQGARAELSRAVSAVFRDVEAILTPTLPVPACKPGEEVLNIAGSIVPVAVALTGFVRTQNVTGLPAMTVPCGRTAIGLPVGLQITAGYFREDILLRVGYAFQEASRLAA